MAPSLTASPDPVRGRQVLRRLQEQEESGWQLGSGVVAGVVCAALALLLAALALIVWR